MLNKLKVLIQYCLPHHGLSRLLGFFAELEWVWFKNYLIRWFLKVYKVDLNEYVETRGEDYASFNNFFTRPLKPGARAICDKSNSIVSPADGVISQFGKISEGTLIQAKGHEYSVLDLVGGNSEWAEPFQSGCYITIYLAPSNYHRVHMPQRGKLDKMIYVPGRLFSVNQLTAASVPKLFARNERVVALFNEGRNEYAQEGGEEQALPMAMTMVGALFVGGIHTVWAGQVTPPHRHSKFVTHYYQNRGNATVLEKGAQMGHFSFGSTVVLLLGSDAVSWVERLQVGQEIKMGQPIAEI